MQEARSKGIKGPVGVQELGGRYLLNSRDGLAMMYLVLVFAIPGTFSAW